MRRVPEAEYVFSDESDRNRWHSVVESLDMPLGVNMKTCLSLVTPAMAENIRGHVRKLGYYTGPIMLKHLLPLIDAARSIFVLRDLGFCDEHSFSFLIILASCVVETRGTYMNAIKAFGKIKRVPPTCMGDTNKISIGMMSKLFGLTKHGDMRRMDCGRVWDLETDRIVANPNFGRDPIHQIVAITHRWKEEEVVYSDLVKLEHANVILEGLGRPIRSLDISTMSVKLRKIRKELQEMNVRYVWMDTLCIDKTSSVELDMSIRSMHRWYSNAAFVYLEAETNFDEWCERGWTLQEGHAARSLVISPRDGKKFFMELIADMDDDDDVHRLGLREWYGYRGSLYWIGLMESRKTTVPEDKAYALIGLLGLDFQIAYGEGRRAMDRLCEELAKQKGDVSWLATTKYRDATGFCKSPLLEEEVRQPPYLNSHPCHEIQITSAGMRLEVELVIGKSATWIHNNRGKRFGDEIPDARDYYWIPQSNVLLLLRGDKDPYKIWAARCVWMSQLPYTKKIVITIDHRYSLMEREP